MKLKSLWALALVLVAGIAYHAASQSQPYWFSTSAPVYYWTTSTTDLRGLQYADPARTDRFAACWYSDPWQDPLVLNVNMPSTPERVSLYLLDWDRLGRQERIDVVDAGTGAILDSRTVNDLTGGVYETWNISGSVQFVITNLAGPNANAVVSGIFVDSTSAPLPGSTPAPTPTPTPTSTPSPSPTPTATPTPTPAPTATPTPTPTPTPSPSPTATPSPTPSPTPKLCGKGKCNHF